MIGVVPVTPEQRRQIHKTLEGAGRFGLLANQIKKKAGIRQSAQTVGRWCASDPEIERGNANTHRAKWRLKG